MSKTKLFSFPSCDLSLDARNGSLVGLKWKNPAIEVIREPRLGENFQILLPRPDFHANYFRSNEQRISRFAPIEGGVVCVYDRLRNGRETVDVSVRYTMRIVSGQLTFTIGVDNRTDLPLAEVYFAMIGGQNGIGDRMTTRAMASANSTNIAEGLFQKHSGGGYGGGNLGIRHAAWGWPNPDLSMPWLSIYNEKLGRGIYYGNHDPETRLSVLYFELRPYTRPSDPVDVWPRREDVADEPIGLTIGWMNMPYTRRGVFTAGPIVFQGHPGDWHEACNIYRGWFDEHFTMPAKPSWLRREHAWQSVILSNSEDVIVHRFKDLPRLAADAKKNGITTFEILGWDAGGIDRGYPDYTPDKRLGTADEFSSALKKISETGVHPVIFTNIQFADTATEQWKHELHAYAIHGRWATDLPLWGWGEGTHSARMGFTRSNMTMVSPAHAAFRELIVRQMRDLVRRGASGLQIDKTCAVAHLDFNAKLTTGPDRSIPEGLLTVIREIAEACRAENPLFALASETWWDRLFQWVDVSYLRLPGLDASSPALRYTFPEWTATVFAENPDDFVQLNNGMRYGLVWAIAARHYNDSVDEPLTRPLTKYLRELIRIRKKHEEVLFLGRYMDTRGAAARSSGKQVRHSVFQSLDGLQKACVVVNHDNHPVFATVGWPGGKKKDTVEVCQPFQRDRRATLPVRLRLPARSCAVVVGTHIDRI